MGSKAPHVEILTVALIVQLIIVLLEAAVIIKVVVLIMLLVVMLAPALPEVVIDAGSTVDDNDDHPSGWPVNVNSDGRSAKSAMDTYIYWNLRR